MLKKSKASRRMLGGATLALLAAPTAAFAYDIAAATAAAEGAACTDARPFYWEIGGSSGAPIASGQVGGTDFARDTTVTLASASKWVFAAYVLQRYGGLPSGSGGAQIIDALNMKLGYTSLNDYLCKYTLTVSGCFTALSNDNHDSAADGHFFYNSGHGQYVASQPALLNLGSKTRNTLFTEVNSYLNLGPSFGYANLPLSSGMQGNAADYATFLQRIMTGYYVISSYLSYSPVVTYPCASGLSGCTPLGSVDFHYSLHHWIEDNTGGALSNGKTLGPGDGAHSSPGAFGFYPWITADKQYYGILSREASSGAPGDSIPCGQAIRKAFLGT